MEEKKIKESFFGNQNDYLIFEKNPLKINLNFINFESFNINKNNLNLLISFSFSFNIFNEINENNDDQIIFKPFIQLSLQSNFIILDYFLPVIEHKEKIIIEKVKEFPKKSILTALSQFQFDPLYIKSNLTLNLQKSTEQFIIDPKINTFEFYSYNFLIENNLINDKIKKTKTFTKSPINIIRNTLEIIYLDNLNLPLRNVSVMTSLTPIRNTKYQGTLSLISNEIFNQYIKNKDKLIINLNSISYPLNDEFSNLYCNNNENNDKDDIIRKQQKSLNDRDSQIYYQEKIINELKEQLRKLTVAFKISQQSKVLLEMQQSRSITDLKQYDPPEEIEKPTKDEIINSTPIKEIPNNNNTDLKIIENDNKIKKTDLQINTEDPFNSSIQLFANIIRFLNSFSENLGSYLSNFQIDLSAFESYLNISGINEENHLSYIKSFKENYSKTIKLLDDLLNKKDYQKVLLDTLRFSKKLSIKYQDQINELIKLQNEQALELQKNTIDQIRDNLESPFLNTSPPQIHQLLILQKIEATLLALESLSLFKNEEEFKEFKNLLERTKFSQTQVQQKCISEDYLDTLLISVQNFLNNFKLKNNKFKNQELAQSSFEEIKNLKIKYKKINKKYKLLKKNLNEEKSKIDILQNQIINLKTKLFEEKEINKGTISLYQAQISILRDLLKHLSSDQDTLTQNPLDLVNNIKSQVLSLQSLLETCRNERDNYKFKFDELDDKLHIKDLEINELIIKNNNLILKIEETEKKLLKNTEFSLFHQNNLDKFRQEKKNDSLIVNQSRNQLEEALKINFELTENLKQFEIDIKKLKTELRESKDQINDLTIKLTFGHYNRLKIPHLSVSSQTKSKIINIQSNSNQEEENNEIIIIESEEEEEIENDKYPTELEIQLNQNQIHEGIEIEDQAVNQVHPPLKAPKTKRSNILETPKIKKNKNNNRPLTSLNSEKKIDQNLSIGEIKKNINKINNS